MALYFFVTDPHGNVEKTVPLFVDDFDKIMSLVDTDQSFVIIRRILNDYYGESEVYLDELKALKYETGSRFKDAYLQIHDCEMRLKERKLR
jgi:hypothetical protein